MFQNDGDDDHSDTGGWSPEEYAYDDDDWPLQTSGDYTDDDPPLTKARQAAPLRGNEAHASRDSKTRRVEDVHRRAAAVPAAPSPSSASALVSDLEELELEDHLAPRQPTPHVASASAKAAPPTRPGRPAALWPRPTLPRLPDERPDAARYGPSDEEARVHLTSTLEGLQNFHRRSRAERPLMPGDKT